MSAFGALVFLSFAGDVHAAEKPDDSKEPKRGSIILDLVDGSGVANFSEKGYTIMHTHNQKNMDRICFYGYNAERKEAYASVTTESKYVGKYSGGSTLQLFDKGADGSVDSVSWITYGFCQPPASSTYNVTTSNSNVVLMPVREKKGRTPLPELPFLLQVQPTFENWKKELSVQHFDQKWRREYIPMVLEKK